MGPNDGTKMVLARGCLAGGPVIRGLQEATAQSIIGATLKRREGSGRVICGFEADSRGILIYAISIVFPGFSWRSGVTLVRCTNANNACTTGNHGND